MSYRFLVQQQLRFSDPGLLNHGHDRRRDRREFELRRQGTNRRTNARWLKLWRGTAANQVYNDLGRRSHSLLCDGGWAAARHCL
jgi:hypothetical protein